MFQMVASHPRLHAIPDETKFIVEGDGLNVLIPALTDRFSVTQSDQALVRFMALMGLRPVANYPMEGTEFGAHLRQMLGAEVYDPALARFIAGLTDFPFAFDEAQRANPYPRHFEDRAELIALTRTFLSDLFDAPALARGRVGWVEKTPSNLIALDLLWDIFPDARVIHIKRDPRGVVHSLRQQDWAPNDLAQATTFLRHIYWRWARARPQLDLAPDRYLEVKLEDLCADPGRVMADVARLTGLTPDFAPWGVDATMADRWRAEMTPAECAHVEAHLAEFFPLMGYRP